MDTDEHGFNRRKQRKRRGRRIVDDKCARQRQNFFKFMRIIRAEHLGMCFGVRDAIELALKQSQSQPLTVLGDLVHNETVLAELRARGVKISQQVESVETQSVMI